MQGLVIVLTIFALTVQLSYGRPPISVVANVRGKKYDITADTVEEFSEQVESLAGLDADQQSVLFRGKVLNSEDKLEDLGIESGDVLNVLKGRKPRAPKPAADFDAGSGAMADPLSQGSGIQLPEGFENMSMEEQKRVLEQMDPEQLEQLRQMQEQTMQRIDAILDQDLDEMFGNEEKLEEMRQQLLQNVERMPDTPGAEQMKEQALEMASDPEKWREAMQAAKEQLMKLKEQRDAQRSGKPPSFDTGIDDFGDE